jgi:hypothetical protein
VLEVDPLATKNQAIRDEGNNKRGLLSVVWTAELCASYAAFPSTPLGISIFAFFAAEEQQPISSAFDFFGSEKFKTDGSDTRFLHPPFVQKRSEQKSPRVGIEPHVSRLTAERTYH